MIPGLLLTVLVDLVLQQDDTMIVSHRGAVTSDLAIEEQQCSILICGNEDGTLTRRGPLSRDVGAVLPVTRGGGGGVGGQRVWKQTRGPRLGFVLCHPI